MSNKIKKQIGKDIIKDVKDVASELWKSGLLIDSHDPTEIMTGHDSSEISFAGKNDANTILYDRHVSAAFLIDSLLLARQYMFLLYDKSIVQAEFMVAEGMIIKERLLFVKKHNKIWSKEEIQEAESEGNDWFDIDEGIPIFIRVDFDPSNHQDCKHPAAHLTISQCENCRIPVKNVVSVSEFMKFVLWHFYGKEFKHKMVRFDSPETISEAEREMLHIDWY